jgi:CO/xanthine dehydrogenase FAD-binding subunit
MTSVRRFSKAASIEEAIALRRADPSARYLAGGTLLLAGDGRDKPESLIDLGTALPRGVAREKDRQGSAFLSIGAGSSFQELIEAKGHEASIVEAKDHDASIVEAKDHEASTAQKNLVPACLLEALLSMANRNTRNRATLGGNLGADKSCSSLVPILLALGAEVEVSSPTIDAPRRFELEAWLRSRAESPDIGRAADLVSRIIVPLPEGLRASYRRWNRVACDLSVLGAAAAYRLEGGKVRGLRLALGGLGPKARRSPLIEALFEGKDLPRREEIEEAVAPLLRPIDDLRASAAFKRLRGAQLIADALRDASLLFEARA